MQNPSMKFKNSTTGKALTLLKPIDQSKLAFITLAQVILGLLDLLGVVLISALGALSIQGIESHQAGNRVSTLLRIFHLEGMAFQNQVAILGTGAALSLILKTFFSVILTKRTFYFLSHRGADFSADLITKVISQNILLIQNRTSQELLYLVTDGVKAILLGILSAGVSIVADSAMLIILTVGIFLVDPITAIFSFLLFVIIGVVLHRLLQVRAKTIGFELNQLTVSNNEKILQVLSSYRELLVHNRISYYAEEIKRLRHKLAHVTAEYSFQPYISKYVIEVTFVLTTLIISGFEFGTKNAVHAISTLGLFMAAASRIAPAALRIQQGVLSVKTSSGTSAGTFALINEVVLVVPEVDSSNNCTFEYRDFYPRITIKDLTFKYPNAEKFALSNISLEIEAGTTIAVVGPSGAGKTTLIDLILGVLDPRSGEISIAGLSPKDSFKKWPGGVSYVPQDVFIFAGTVRENIELGFDQHQGEEAVLHALHLAQLDEVILGLPEGINSQVGENGVRLSGGQRQRLGIARALFTKPKLLVLDEATSALDAKTEEGISAAIGSLRGKTTVIIVAHRLSTIKNADRVVYIDNGKIISVGTFDEVKAAVKDFDYHAKLLDL
jgi:ATP-binding cassette, subfamily B, bacterial PglK